MAKYVIVCTDKNEIKEYYYQSPLSFFGVPILEFSKSKEKAVILTNKSEAEKLARTVYGAVVERF